MHLALDFQHSIHNGFTPKARPFRIGMDRILHELFIDDRLALAVCDKDIRSIEEFDTSCRIGVALQLEIDFLNNGPGGRRRQIFVVAKVVTGQKTVQDNNGAGMKFTNFIDNAKVPDGNGIGIARIVDIIHSNEEPPNFGMKSFGGFSILQSIQEIANAIARNTEGHAVDLGTATSPFVKELVKYLFVASPRGSIFLVCAITKINAIPVFRDAVTQENHIGLTKLFVFLIVVGVARYNTQVHGLDFGPFCVVALWLGSHKGVLAGTIVQFLFVQAK